MSAEVVVAADAAPEPAVAAQEGALVVQSSREHPCVIPSRYLADLRYRWDSHVLLHSTLVAFRETLISVQHHAEAALSRWEAALLDVMDRLGSTRHRTNLPKAGTQQTLEATVSSFTWLIRRCAELLAELDEHVGNYTQAFVEMMRKIIDEYKGAPRGDEPFGADAAAVVPTLFEPYLLDVARDVPPVTIDSVFFTVEEKKEISLKGKSAPKAPSRRGTAHFEALPWSESTAAPSELLGTIVNTTECGNQRKQSVAFSTASETSQEQPPAAPAPAPVVAVKPKKQPKFKFRVSCVCIDDSASTLGTVFVGCDSGLVFGIPSAVATSTDGSAESLMETIATLAQQTVSGGQRYSFADLRQRRSSYVKKTHLDGVTLYRGHVYPVIHLSLFYHNGVKYLASASEDKTVRVSNVETAALINIFVANAGVISQTRYHPGLAGILSCSFDGTVSLWDVTTGNRNANLAKFEKPVHSVYYEDVIGITYCGTRTGHVYGVRLPEARKTSVQVGNDLEMNAECVQCFLPDIHSATQCPVDRTRTKFVGGGHSSSAAVVHLCSISGFLFSGDSSGMVIQWDTHHNALVRKYHGHVDDITGVVLTQDGFLFTCSKDALINVWNMGDGNLLRRINRHFNRVSGLCVGYVDQPRRRSVAAMTMVADEAAAALEAEKELAKRGGWSASREQVSVSKPPPGKDVVMLSVSADETLILWSLQYDK